MAHRIITGIATVLLLSAAAFASPTLPMDRPQKIDGVTAVCTGIGDEQDRNVRWQSYPLRIVVAGKLGQYLSDTDLTIARKGKAVVAMRCHGPVILVKLKPARYRIIARREGHTATTAAYAQAKGQGIAYLRFPKQGGSVSAQYLKSLRQQASAAPPAKPQHRRAARVATARTK